MQLTFSDLSSNKSYNKACEDIDYCCKLIIRCVIPLLYNSRLKLLKFPVVKFDQTSDSFESGNHFVSKSEDTKQSGKNFKLRVISIIFQSRLKSGTKYLEKFDELNSDYFLG